MCFSSLLCLLRNTLSLDTLWQLRRIWHTQSKPRFFKANFANRLQYACYDAFNSLFKCHELGVIKGLQSGQLFFDKFFIDFARMRSYDVGTNLEELTDHVNSRLRNILDWCTCTKLTINPLKSELMIVTNNRLETRPQLFFGKVLIIEVKSFM